MIADTTADLRGFIRRLTLEMAAETLCDLSDQQLVLKALAGCDEAVFQALMRRHGTMVYGVCWRVLQDEHDAEDAFQATFLVLAQKLRTLRKHASLASWLHGVARRIALKAQAQTAARRRHERQALANEAGVPPDFSQEEVSAVLDVELARLPDKWRLPLILCFLEGQTQDEAADRLGVSKNTLRNRLDEARKMLASRLTQRGVVWPSVLFSVVLSDCIALAACSVVLAPDGKTLASSARSFEQGAPTCRELKIWNLASGKLVRDIECKDDISGGGACGLAFAPGKQLLAAACTGEFRGIKVWDTVTGREIKRFTYNESFPLAIAISPDGKWLVAGGGDATKAGRLSGTAEQRERLRRERAILREIIEFKKVTGTNN